MGRARQRRDRLAPPAFTDHLVLSILIDFGGEIHVSWSSAKVVSIRPDANPQTSPVRQEIGSLRPAKPNLGATDYRPR
jgi:hypothetical protein